MFQKTNTRLAFLVHEGSAHTNLMAVKAVIDAKKINAEIAVIISDKEGNVLETLEKAYPDYICLAGWKKIIPEEMITKYENRILNLHPGLIPDENDKNVKNPDGTEGLWNKGLYGNRAIQNFLDQKSTYAGSSIHFLTPDFDFGPVLGRTFEKIEAGDTAETLYARLKKKENELYIKVLEKLCKND